MQNDIHTSAARGFALAPDAYERGRPDYPTAGIEYLVRELPLNARCTVVDLGAGTGKLTRLIVPSGARIIAVEPIKEMREKFKLLQPDVEIVAGTAQAMPLTPSSADAVIIAQAFHWFANEAALAEIARVLRPGGKLALVWNVRDESEVWVSALAKIIEPYESGTPRFRSGEWRRPFASTEHFAPLESVEFEHRQMGSAETLVDRVASISFIAALPAPNRTEVLHRVRRYVNNDPKLGKNAFAIPYRTKIFVYKNCRGTE